MGGGGRGAEGRGGGEGVEEGQGGKSSGTESRQTKC